MPALKVHDQTEDARDLRNVLLFGAATSLVLGSLALIGVPTGILKIPLSYNLLLALAGVLTTAAGLAGLRFNLPARRLTWGALIVWTVIFTLAIHFTGGPQTPMPAVYVLITVAAAFLLDRKGAMVIAGLSLLGYAIVLALEYSGVLEIVQIWDIDFEPRGRELLLIVNLLTVAAPTLVAGALASTLAERLAERNRQSNELRQQALERLSNAQQTNRQLRALQAGLSTFQSVLDLDETLKRIATAVCGLGYTMAYTATFDEQDDCLTIRAPVTTLAAETVRATEALAGRPFTGATFTRADADNIGVQSFLSGKALVSQSLYDFYRPLVSPDVAAAIAQMIKFGCGAALPLHVEGRLVGTLFALTARPSLAEADLDLLQAFADQASMALERARLFAEVRLGRDHLQAVLNSTRDGVIMVDQDGRLATFNPAALEWLDQGPDQLAGASWPDVLARLGQRAGLDAAGTAALQAAMTDPGCISTRHTFEIPGPPRRYLELMCWPVSSQAAEEAGRLMVLHDITHQKELEASREELTHMLVHDLRGPLSSVIAGMYLAKDTVQINDVSTTLQSVDLALSGAEHLLELINSLLDVYKLEAGRMQLEIAPVDLGALITASLKPFEPAALSDRIELRAELAPDLPMVPADAAAVQRVLSNLVDNALKFTPPDSRVTVRARLAAGAAHVSVADSGPGIPPEARPHIFEKFSQAAGPKGKRRGTGLGLTFCKLVVEAHGGRIWVDSPPEGGSVFTFTLPLSAPAA